MTQQTRDQARWIVILWIVGLFIYQMVEALIEWFHSPYWPRYPY